MTKALLDWLPSISLLLMGAGISQDIELHVAAGTVLMLAAALILMFGYRLDQRGPRS